MTIEEKAKRYDESLEQLKGLIESTEEGKYAIVKEDIIEIFPELQESEDERIRMGLIELFNDIEWGDSILHDYNMDKDKTIAWLENQSESDEIKAKEFLINKGYPIDANGTFPTYEEMYNIIREGLEKQGKEDSSIQQAYKQGYIEGQRIERKSWIEKQGEKKSTLPKWKYKKDHTPLLRDSIILNKYGGVTKSPSGAIVSDVWVLDYGELAKLPKEEIEKQDEQKFTDNIVPKFHEGDWITNSIETLQITGYDIDYGYQVDYKGNLLHRNTDIIEKEYHLWAIQDAKEGDVLAAEDKDKIFIYNGKLDLRGRVCAYCGIYKTHDGLRFTECAVGNYFTYKEPYPATKEQRDTLEKAMTDAGYEWSDKDRKLIKIVK